MIPMVFCASLAPCDREKSAELRSWAPRKTRSTRCGEVRWKIQSTATIRVKPAAIPIIGERTMKLSVWIHFVPHSIAASHPALAIAAPAYPPISACDELDGIP